MSNLPQYSIRELHNKSRNGFYIYIKEPNKRGKYYKYYKNVPITTYLGYYYQRQEGIKTKLIPQKIKKSTSGITITKLKSMPLKKHAVTTFDITSTPISSLPNIYRELFKQTTKNKKNIEFLTEYGKHLKNHYHYSLEIYGKTERSPRELLAKIEDYDIQSLEEFYSKYKTGALRLKGSMVDYNDFHIATIHVPSQKKKFYSKGIANSITVTMHFRK